MENTISAPIARWRSCPFTRVTTVSPAKSAGASTGWPSGQKVSNPLPRVHCGSGRRRARGGASRAPARLFPRPLVSSGLPRRSLRPMITPISPSYSTCLKHVEYEGEIGVIIGRRLRRGSPEETRGRGKSLAGARDAPPRALRRPEPQWTRGKGFDTFCPLGQPVDAPADFAGLTVVTRVNGQERQRAMGADMVFSIPVVLSYISQFMTLEPGDLVCTGTPSGVGKLSPGDEVEVEILGLSKVTNKVVAEQQ